MPPYSSHLLQPLNVSCFSPLKHEYSEEINKLIRCRINHITKLKFLPAFKAAFYQAFIATNIRSSFRGAGLVPFNPESVLLKLNVVVRTPSPLALPEPTWVSQTPTNARELQAQSTLVHERIQRHQSSSPASIIASLSRLTKGAEKMVHSAVLIHEELSALQKANEVATKRKQRKRKRIQKHGTLTVAEGAKLAAQKAATQQQEDERRQEAAQSGVRQRATIRCSRCKKLGHNSRTCKEDTVDTAQH
jgi:hypothetical protein